MIESIVMDQSRPIGARLKVIGVGGGGGNAVNNMIEADLDNVEYLVANTDAQALDRSLAASTLQMGTEMTRGLGAGADPEVGYRAAIEDQDQIAEAVGEVDMVFVTAGMGGGTGTGAAPVVAKLAREAGALTVAVVTRPFTFEGRARRRRAEAGLQELAETVDTLIVIPNDRLLELADENTSLRDGFRIADSVLMEAVRGITDIILTPGLINVDFADVVAIMQGRGLALRGTGLASGSSRAREAAIQAINSPLLEDVRIESATGLLVNITGGPTTTLREVNEAMSLIQDAVHEETDTIFGAVIDETMGEKVKITVVATGFEHVVEARPREPVVERTRPMRPAVSRPDPLSIPPLPIEEAVEEPVLVPVYVNENPGYAEASVAAPAVMAQPPSTSATAMAISLPDREGGVEGDGYGTRSTDLDAPAFQRRALSESGKREPVIRNPFSVDESVGRFERPAYLRK